MRAPPRPLAVRLLQFHGAPGNDSGDLAALGSFAGRLRPCLGAEIDIHKIRMENSGRRLRDDRAAENSFVLAFGVKESTALQTDNRWLGRFRRRVGAGQIGGGVAGCLGTARRTSKDGVHRRSLATQTMPRKRRMRSGEFQHGRRNGIASLPQASRFLGLSEKSGQICGVVEMCVIRNYMYRARSGKDCILLAISLAISRLDTAGRIGISGGARNFNRCRTQLSVGFLDARAAG